jgi:hypothetical protein
MSTKTRQPQQAPATSTEKNATRYDCFAVRTYEIDGTEKHEWIKCGVAFPHKDNQGFRIVLAAVPCDGQIVVRVHQPNAAE